MARYQCDQTTQSLLEPNPTDAITDTNSTEAEEVLVGNRMTHYSMAAGGSVPEPSTYTALCGAVVLGFAAYTRWRAYRASWFLKDLMQVKARSRSLL